MSKKIPKIYVKAIAAYKKALREYTVKQKAYANADNVLAAADGVCSRIERKEYLRLSKEAIKLNAALKKGHKPSDIIRIYSVERLSRNAFPATGNYMPTLELNKWAVCDKKSHNTFYTRADARRYVDRFVSRSKKNNQCEIIKQIEKLTQQLKCK